MQMPDISRKLMFVDDQEEVLALLRQQFGREFEAVFVSSTTEALARLQAEGPFAVVVADYSMPEMDGIAFLREVHGRSRETAAIMLTAYTDLEIAVSALHEGRIFRFLNKPWQQAQLRKAVRDGLEQYRLVVSERIVTADLKRVNAQLRERVAQLQAMNQLMHQWMEFSPAVIYSTSWEDGGYRPTYVSANLSRLMGYDRAELLADPDFWSRRIHPEDRDRVLAERDRAVDEADTESHTSEYRVRNRDGQYRWIRDSYRVVPHLEEGAAEIVGAWVALDEQGSAAAGIA